MIASYRRTIHVDHFALSCCMVWHSTFLTLRYSGQLWLSNYLPFHACKLPSISYPHRAPSVRGATASSCVSMIQNVTPVFFLENPKPRYCIRASVGLDMLCIPLPLLRAHM